ncbi:MAG: ribosome maturation factor RimP [candidate division WOR-3 bacterium]
MTKQIEPALLNLIQKTIEACGVELYDINYKGNLLQVFITAANPITIDTCAQVSQALSVALDMENLIPKRYFLEVSSPGLERKLRHQNDFQVSLNKTVAIKTNRGKFIGKIIAVNEDGVTIENIVGSCAKPLTQQFINYQEINSAQLIVSNQELFKTKNKREGKSEQ